MDRIWLGKHCFGFPLVCLALHLLCFETSGAELSYSVPEELTPGTVVGYIAKDSSLDLGKALQRNPRLVSDSNAKYFDMDLSSGALLIKETLDRETICGASIKCHLRLQLILQNPIEMFPVVIEIVDVNDNQPKFQMGNTSLEVSEAAPPGTTFRLECAQDLDVGKNSLRTYALSPNDCFILKVEIKDDGRKFPVLVLNKPLDREKRSVFQLVLTAIDGGKPEKSGTTLITLDVLDVNDNAPEFDQPTQRISLLENSPSGTLVTILNASDADHSLNGAIFFTFDKYTPGHVLELFSLDSLTGEMRVKGSVDHELAALYDITIQARDRGSPSMEGSCSIKIEIIDVNDNTPVIEVKSLSQVISEDAELGTVIAIISVRDEDMGENGDVSVRILPGLPFKLSYSFEEHYTLVTDGVLDREAVAEYTVTVTATDSGSPPRSSQASFVVRLSDVNDNAPVFSQPSYSVDVAENNAPNAPLLTVSAFDPDVRENSTLTFSILEGDVHGAHVSSYVYMNANKGDIYVLRALDYEQMNAFQIVVQVRDMGVPSQSSNVTVHVFVKDVNDHSPALMYPSLPPDGTLQFIVPSSAGKGYLVNRITCVDGDSGHNAWLFYSLSGPDAGLFHVGAHTGELRTAGRLAEEGGRSVFSLAVLVQDNGRPTLSTTVAVNITVAEKGSDITAERRSSMPKRGTSSDLTLYLMVSLTCISAVSLLTLALLLVRWLGKRGHLTCLSHTPCFRHAIHQHPNQDLHLQLNTDGPISYMEVVGQPQGRHKHTYTPCFSTISSRSDFVFVKTPHSALSMSLSKRLFTNSFRKQKPPNNDWRLPPNQRPGPSGQHRFHTMQQRWTPYDKARAGARPEEAPGVVAGTGPWPNPPTEAEQLQALMAAANEVSEATATLGPRYNAQYAPDYRQNVYIPGSTATLMANPQQQMQQQQQQQQQQLIQQALPPAQAMVPVEPPKAAQTPASKKKSTKKDKK